MIHASYSILSSALRWFVDISTKSRCTWWYGALLDPCCLPSIMKATQGALGAGGSHWGAARVGGTYGGSWYRPRLGRHRNEGGKGGKGS